MVETKGEEQLPPTHSGQEPSQKQLHVHKSAESDNNNTKSSQ